MLYMKENTYQRGFLRRWASLLSAGHLLLLESFTIGEDNNALKKI